MKRCVMMIMAVMMVLCLCCAAYGYDSDIPQDWSRKLSQVVRYSPDREVLEDGALKIYTLETRIAAPEKSGELTFVDITLSVVDCEGAWCFSALVTITASNKTCSHSICDMNIDGTVDEAYYFEDGLLLTTGAKVRQCILILLHVYKDQMKCQDV